MSNSALLPRLFSAIVRRLSSPDMQVRTLVLHNALAPPSGKFLFFNVLSIEKKQTIMEKNKNLPKLKKYEPFSLENIFF